MHKGFEMNIEYLEDKSTIWTERELQLYRELVCNDEMQLMDSCDRCTKTKEEIDECFKDLCNDVCDDACWDSEEQVCN